MTDALFLAAVVIVVCAVFALEPVWAVLYRHYHPATETQGRTQVGIDTRYRKPTIADDVRMDRQMDADRSDY